MTVTIVGVGLIGGSLALDLKARGFAQRVIGVDSNPVHSGEALKLGLVDEIKDLPEALTPADLVVLAMSVDEVVRVLPGVLDMFGDRAIVTDVGSTKAKICDTIRGHPLRSRFVASHPIAGTENSGPRAAIRHLFDKRTAILCDIGESDGGAVETIQRMYHALRMKTVCMDSVMHDRHTAYVSHISHVASFALAATVLEIEESEAMIFDLASSGLDSTVRLAKSSPDMWTPILEQNARFVSEALDAYLRHLVRFKDLIDKRNEFGVYDFMKKANEIRRVLEDINGRRGDGNRSETAG